MSSSKKSLKYPGAADEARTAAQIGALEVPEIVLTFNDLILKFFLHSSKTEILVIQHQFYGGKRCQVVQTWKEYQELEKKCFIYLCN